METIMNEENKISEFALKTREVLDHNVTDKDGNKLYKNKNVEQNGFAVFGEKQDVILLLGMNPAGDDNDAANQYGKTYLQYIPGYIDIKDRSYSKYFSPILETFEKVTDDNVKWDWVNIPDVRALIEKDKVLREHEKTICDFYSNYKEKKYTICCGDLFYYHLTEQNKFCQLVIKSKSKKNEYLRNILKMHIQQIKKNENQIRLIYINNATASKWIYEAINQKDDKDDFPSYFDYELDGKSYRIFFGGMLSGQRAMDVFSRKRLIMEMQQYLKKTKCL